MKPRFILTCAIVIALGINSVNAQIRQRSQNQRHRIKEGVKSGELTKHETANLIDDRKEIHQDVKLAKSDGKVTPGERKIITKEENQESRKIYRKKHNNKDRN